jgi:hypothetical protein
MVMVKRSLQHFSFLVIGTITFSVMGMERLSSEGHAGSHPSFCARIHEQWQEASPLKRMVVVAMPLAIIGSAFLYYVVNREESLEKKYEHVRVVYENIITKYHTGGLLPPDQFSTPRTEGELAMLVPLINDALFNQVAGDVQRLKDTHHGLQVRINRAPVQRVTTEIRELAKAVKRLIAQLETLKLFWQYHSNYFIGRSTLQAIADHYAMVRVTPLTPELLKRGVMTFAVSEKSSYPYLTFVQKLEERLRMIKQCSASVRQYPMLYGMAQALHEELMQVMGLAVTLEEYTHELHLKKQHQLEEERIAIERQKAAAEQAKADAMVEQAAAERAKAAAMYQQAAAERQKAHTLQQQAMHPSHINIHVEQPAPPPAPFYPSSSSFRAYPTAPVM